MKNVWMYLLFSLVGWKSLGQGVDLIFLFDRSFPIEILEHNNINASMRNIKDAFLDCNPANRFAHVQFASDAYSDPPTPRMMIAQLDTINYTGFASADTEAFIPVQHYTWYEFGGSGYGNQLHNIIPLLDEALSMGADQNPGLLQQGLERSPTNALVIFTFIKPSRGDIVNPTSTTYGSNGAFLNYTNFKNEYDATFMMCIEAVTTEGRKASASVASVGGTYNSTIEGYPDDPDGNGVLPRYLTTTTNFYLSTTQIEQIVDEICAITLPCHDSLSLSSPDDDIDYINAHLPFYKQAGETITASNVIDSPSYAADVIYHAGEAVVLEDGFHCDTFDNFWAYIEGCSYQFEGMSFRQNMMPESQNTKETQLFLLYPNPANESVTIISDKEMVNISVTSMTGVVLFNHDIKTNNYELNISNYLKGFYVVNVTTSDGMTEQQKLIKE